MTTGAPFTNPCVANPFPTVREPIWNATCQEWLLTDSDGIAYGGDTPSACYRQFAEALHYLAVHAGRSHEYTPAELCAQRTR